MSEDKNRKRARDLRWIGIQSVLVGVVLIAVACLFCFIFLNQDPNSRPNGYLAGKGLGFLLICGVLGLWMIVRGIIYFIRAFSGNEQYAKGVVDVIDKMGSRYEAVAERKVGRGSTQNVFVLLCWVFLFLAIIGAILIGYEYWTRPR